MSIPSVSTSTLRLTLSKFSYANDPLKSKSNFSWVHMLHDLHVEFDEGQSIPRSVSMRVFQGGNLLEHLDITEKGYMCSQTVETARVQRINVGIDDLPIVVLTRNPAIAIRYNLSNNLMARRLQLKFSSGKDFQVALDIIQNSGCHITSAKGPVVRLDTPSSSTIQGVAQNFSTPLRPSTASSLISGSSATLPDATSSNLLPPRPSTSPLKRSFTPSQLTFDPLQSGASGTGHFNRLHRTSSNQSAQPQMQDSIAQQPSFANNGLHGPKNLYISSSGVEPSSDTLQHSPASNTNNAMPSMGWSNEDRHNDALIVPPRRELPFTRPSTAGRASSFTSAKNKEPWRPSTASLTKLPSLPTPTFAERASTTQSSPQGSSILMQTGSADHRSGKNANRHLSPIREIPEYDHASRTTTKASPSLPKASASSRPVSPNKENVAPEGSHVQAAGAPAFEQLASELSRDATAADVSSLSGYADQNHEQRTEALNNFMIQHIGDDNFLALCEDTFGCWRRIGLGI